MAFEKRNNKQSGVNRNYRSDNRGGNRQGTSSRGGHGGNSRRSAGRTNDKRYDRREKAEKIKLTPARRMAVEITREVRQRDAFARELIDTARSDWAFSMADFDYMQVLVFGVVMTRGTLDELINRNLNSPTDIQNNVRDALRISAYELLYLKKPAHVVVDQGVEMVRYVAPKAAGLGNAVLRKMVRDSEAFPWGDKDTDTKVFARFYGVPKWLAESLILQYGHERAEELLSASLEPAPTYAVDNPYSQNARFAADLASQQTASMVPVDGTVLEIGAGRGTKTMLMQRNAHAWYREPAVIHTVDIHAFKEDLLRRRMAEQRIPNVFTHTGDATDLDAIMDLPEYFDAVFIDAPCSGTGTLRRHPEIRWNLKKNAVSDLAAIQLKMLKSASHYVKDDCVMVYATCSILRRENQEVIASFLKSEEGKGFEIVECAPAFEEFDESVTEEGFFASLPMSGKPDGHFAAVLKYVG